MKTLLLISLFFLNACGTEEDGSGEAAIPATSATTNTYETFGDEQEETSQEELASTDQLKEAEEYELGPNEWRDNITGTVWLLGSQGTWHQAKAACAGDYRSPSNDELLLAATRGLFSYSYNFAGITSGWSVEEYSVDWNKGLLVDSASLSPYWSFDAKGISHGIFCIRD